MQAESSDSRITCGDRIVVFTGVERFDITETQNNQDQSWVGTIFEDDKENQRDRET